MKKVFLASLAGATILASAGLAFAQYAAIATNVYGDAAYVSGYPTMESARQAAISLCRNKLGGSCDKTVAESIRWYFSAVTCNGKNYVGASKWGYDLNVQGGRVGSDVEAYKKGAYDGNYDCFVKFRYVMGAQTYDINWNW